MSLEVQRGQSVRWRFLLKEGSNPLDITGAEWEVLEPNDDTITMMIEDAENGESYLMIDKDTTLNYKSGRRTIRLRLVLSDGSAIAPEAIIFRVK